MKSQQVGQAGLEVGVEGWRLAVRQGWAPPGGDCPCCARATRLPSHDLKYRAPSFCFHTATRTAQAFITGTGYGVSDWLHRIDGLPALAHAALTAFSLFAFVPSPLLLPPEPEIMGPFCSPGCQNPVAPPMPASAPVAGPLQPPASSNPAVQERLAAAAEQLYAMWCTAPEVAVALAECGRLAQEERVTAAESGDAAAGGGVAINSSVTVGGGGGSAGRSITVARQAVAFAAIRWLTRGQNILYDDHNDDEEYDMDDFESDSDDDDDDDDVFSAARAVGAAGAEAWKEAAQQGQANALMERMWGVGGAGGGGADDGTTSGASISWLQHPLIPPPPPLPPPLPPPPPRPMSRQLQPQPGLRRGLWTASTSVPDLVDQVLLPIVALSPFATDCYRLVLTAKNAAKDAIRAARVEPDDKAKALAARAAEQALAAAEKAAAAEALATMPAALPEVTVAGAAQVAAMLLFLGETICRPYGFTFYLEPADSSSSSAAGNAAGSSSGALRFWGFKTRRVPVQIKKDTWMPGTLLWDRIKAHEILIRSEAMKWVQRGRAGLATGCKGQGKGNNGGRFTGTWTW